MQLDGAFVGKQVELSQVSNMSEQMCKPRHATQLDRMSPSCQISFAAMPQKKELPDLLHSG